MRNPLAPLAPLIVAALGAAFVISGCGQADSTNSTPSHTKVASTTVSPACKAARETVDVEDTHPGLATNPTYARENKEVMQEECGASARERWSAIQHEQTPQAEAKREEETEARIKAGTKAAQRENAAIERLEHANHDVEALCSYTAAQATAAGAAVRAEYEALCKK